MEWVEPNRKEEVGSKKREELGLRDTGEVRFEYDGSESISWLSCGNVLLRF